MEVLRDQVWNGVSAILAVIAIAIEVIVQRDKIQSLGMHIFAALICALGGIAVMSVGPLLQTSVMLAFSEGIPDMMRTVSAALSENGSQIFASGIMFGIFPGTATAMAALSGSDRPQRIRRAIVAAIASLIVADAVIFMNRINAPMGSFLASVVSDILGGALAGYLIALFTEFIVKVIDPN